MVRPLPTLSGAALVPRGRRGQSDESAVSALPQDRDGVARDVLDAGPFAARHGGEEAARRVEVLWAAARSLPRFSATDDAVARRLATAFTLALVACHRNEPTAGGQSLRHWARREIRLLVEPIKRTTCRCNACDFATGGIVGGRVRVCA